MNLIFFKHCRVLSLKRNKKSFQKRCKSPKNCLTVDIARDRSKTLKNRGIKRGNEKKSNNSFFNFTFLYVGKKTYILLEHIFEETQFLFLHSHCRFFTQQVIGNAVTTNANIDIPAFVEAILRSKILGNMLGNLTQILIATDYFFYLCTSDK